MCTSVKKSAARITYQNCICYLQDSVQLKHGRYDHNINNTSTGLLYRLYPVKGLSLYSNWAQYYSTIRQLRFIPMIIQRHEQESYACILNFNKLTSWDHGRVRLGCR